MKKNDMELKDLVNDINSIRDELVEIFSSTNDQHLRDQIGFILVDHFKSEKIEKKIIELITEDKWINRNGTLLYLLYEYTDSSKHLYFLIDLLLQKRNKDDGEILMNAYNMILNLNPPFEKVEINKSLQRLRRELTKNICEDKINMIKTLIKFLLGQREIYKFYKQF